MDDAARPRVVLADTTPLFAAFSPSDQYHDRAQDDLHRLERARIPVAGLTTTVLDGHSLVLFRQGAIAANTWLDAITRSAKPIHPTMEDFEAALLQIPRFPDQRLTIFDAIVYVISDRLRIPIWSYDHHFDVLRANRWY